VEEEAVEEGQDAAVQAQGGELAQVEQVEHH
jgi:hypothetical protein